MGSTFGHLFRVTTFGESHGGGVGVVVDGCPPLLPLTVEDLQRDLEGPAREVIRSKGEVRCYYPDAKVVRIEPRTFRNAFPSLSAQQQKALTEYYELRKAEADRVAGLDVQAWIFEPKDGLRYGQKLWFERATGSVTARSRVQ